MGNPILNAVFKIWPEDTPSQKFVVKQYSTILNTIKWISLRFFTFLGIKYDINEVLRIQNEINGLNWCQQQSILTPRLYDTHKTQVVMDFIEGVPLDEFSNLSTPELINAYKDFGTMLAKIHAKGFSIGDCKAENVLLDVLITRHIVREFGAQRALCRRRRRSGIRSERSHGWFERRKKVKR